MEPWQGQVLRGVYNDYSVVDLTEKDHRYDIPKTCNGNIREWRRHVSNVVRWNLLYDFGGIYFDWDVIPRAKLEGFWIAAHGRVCTCAISVPEPKNKVVERILDAIHSSPSAPTSVEASGEALVDKLWPYERIQLAFDSAGRLIDPSSPLIHVWHKVRA